MSSLRPHGPAPPPCTHNPAGLDCLSFQQRAPARVAGGKVPAWMRMIAHTVEFQYLRCATAPLPTLLPSTALLPRRQTSCPACLSLRCTEHSPFEILAGICGGPDTCPTSLAPAKAQHSIVIEHMHGDWQTCANFDRPRNNQWSRCFALPSLAFSRRNLASHKTHATAGKLAT